MELILNMVPEFEPAWQAHLEFWGEEEAGLSNDFGVFAAFLINSMSLITNEKKKDIFSFAETCMKEADESVKDAVATCFFENILNAVSEERVNPSLFVDMLGEESRAYCKAWDEFTGVQTPGL